MTGTRKQVAALLLLSERRITELTQANVLPKPEGKRGYDLTACVQAYIKFLRTKPGAVTEHRARLLGAQASLAELNLKLREGELYERRAVDNDWFRSGREMRDCMLNIPDRVSGPCAGETDQHIIHAMLTKEILQALHAISDEAKPNYSPVEHTDGKRTRRARPGHPRHVDGHRGSA
jgi:phage terminase Nu1 subunit (DNA packaging protein)